MIFLYYIILKKIEILTVIEPYSKNSFENLDLKHIQKQQKQQKTTKTSKK